MPRIFVKWKQLKTIENTLQIWILTPISRNKATNLNKLNKFQNRIKIRKKIIKIRVQMQELFLFLNKNKKRKKGRIKNQRMSNKKQQKKRRSMCVLRRVPRVKMMVSDFCNCLSDQKGEIDCIFI